MAPAAWASRLHIHSKGALLTGAWAFLTFVSIHRVFGSILSHRLPQSPQQSIQLFIHLPCSCPPFDMLNMTCFHCHLEPFCTPCTVSHQPQYHPRTTVMDVHLCSRHPPAHPSSSLFSSLISLHVSSRGSYLISQKFLSTSFSFYCKSFLHNIDKTRSCREVILPGLPDSSLSAHR